MLALHNQNNFANEHFEELKKAKYLLEKQSLAVQIADKIGKPIEIGLNSIPAKYKAPINKAVQKSLTKAVEYLAYSFNNGMKLKSGHYKTAAASFGFGSGFFGAAALPVELPLTTMVILRSILEIAKDNGEDINDLRTQLNCLEIFALGGNTETDNAAESGYYAVRAALAKMIDEAAAFAAEKGLFEEGAPILIRLVTNIAARYSIVVSEKVVAQLLPIIGGVTGAGINYIFIGHFQNIAQGHFIIRKLERIYSPRIVKEIYDSISL